MNTLRSKYTGNEKGATLIITVLVLAVVSAIGVMATRSATTEIRIAAHDKAHKMTWFLTDGVTSEMSSILLEKNFESRGFGDEGDPLPITLAGASPNLEIYERSFYQNVRSDSCEANFPSETDRDIALAGTALGGGTDVHLRIFQDRIKKREGNSWIMVDGYSVSGKSMAGGGYSYEYVINGLGLGPVNSQARVTARYELIP